MDSNLNLLSQKDLFNAYENDAANTMKYPELCKVCFSEGHFFVLYTDEVRLIFNSDGTLYKKDYFGRNEIRSADIITIDNEPILLELHKTENGFTFDYFSRNGEKIYSDYQETGIDSYAYEFFYDKEEQRIYLFGNFKHVNSFFGNSINLSYEFSVLELIPALK